MTRLSEDDPYADIRPYTDAEVPAVAARVARDSGFARAMARLRLPGLRRFAPGLAHWLVQRWLIRQAKSLHTISDFQLLLEPHLTRIIDETARFTVSGLDKLDKSQSYLFISNHRDIAMDPACANLALHRAGHRTVNIAIGDNLLKSSWVADVMRLNKSFIVRRNISKPRELMAASKQLAGFIRSTVTENRGSVWIAQREGRAKDGIDATEPAVIKMLTLARDRKLESADAVLQSLNIVPIAIAYELDPCDRQKAAELAAGGSYRKSDDEDVQSIGRGIMGQKGGIHIAFGDPIDNAGDVDDVVREIDRQVHRNYALFPTNIWAWEKLNGAPVPMDLPVQPGTVSREAFAARVDAVDPEHQHWMLTGYANPVQTALACHKDVSQLAR
ncbi:1-acyl-sn-glycerol-3-phosphate acyltransferase [Luminiphilus syltensis]|nr:1-acyl-sn-glycerol-3-phosphate acyltransferase [Luminiphilus syltensis]